MNQKQTEELVLALVEDLAEWREMVCLNVQSVAGLIGKCFELLFDFANHLSASPIG